MTQDTKIIIERFDRMDSKFDQIDKRFDAMENKFEKLIKDEVEGLAIMTTNGFDRLEARIEKLEKVRV